MASLAEIYLRHRPDARGDDLEEHLAAAIARAEDGLAGVSIDGPELARGLAELDAPLTELDPDAIVELALGLACARGERAAIDLLERDYLGPAKAALASMKLDAAAQADVLQEVRTKLLVGEPPKIALYAGRGSLRGLLKVTATRTAISALRKAGRFAEAPDDELAGAQTTSGGELDFLKERYRAAFRAAFEDALAALEPRERNLLRLHFLRKVTLEALATMYGVHRATVVRQLARARETLERATYASLRERLRVDAKEIDGVIELIQSRFEVSAERLLRTVDSGEPLS
ncbi:MAG: sigma-70 family RNA polymerase sigma factor [Sandaracinaceae bacterium]